VPVKKQQPDLLKRLNASEDTVAKVIAQIVLQLRDIQDYFDTEMTEFKDFANNLEKLIVENKIDYGLVGKEIRKMISSMKDEFKGDEGKIGLKGKDGKDGKSGKDGRDGKDGKNGKDGVDGKNGVNGTNGKDGKDGSPDMAEDIRNKLELLEGDDRLDKSAIKGLEELTSKVVFAGGGSSKQFTIHDLTSQTNGTLKVFSVPGYYQAWAVICSDFPTILFKDNGFTIDGQTLTLTVTNAPSSGAQLGFICTV